MAQAAPAPTQYNENDYDFSKSDAGTQVPATADASSSGYNENDYDFSKSDAREQMGEAPLTPLQQAYNDEYEKRINDHTSNPFGIDVAPMATAASSVLGGLGPVLVGGEQALEAKAGLLGPDAQKIPMADIYNAARGGFQNSLADYASSHPISAGISNISGALPGIESLLGHGAAWVGEHLGAPILGRIGGATAAGGARGIGNTASEGGTLKDYVTNGGEGAILGGVSGGALEGINGASDLASGYMSSPLGKAVVGKGLQIGGGAALGGALGAGTAAATGGNVMSGLSTGASLGAAGATMGIKSSASKQNGVDSLTPEQRQIALQKVTGAFGSSSSKPEDYEQAATALENAGNQSTMLGAMSPTARQSLINNLTPDDFNKVQSTMANKQQVATQKIADNVQNTKNDLKQAIENHTGVSEGDASTSVGTPGRYTGYQDPMANLHNVFTSVNAGHLDPVQFSNTPHGQLFDKQFPDSQGNINDAFTKYSNDLQSHQSDIDKLNQDYDFSGLKAPTKPSSTSDVKQGALFGALSSPHNPIMGGLTGAASMYDFTKSPEVINASTPIQSQGISTLVDKSPKSIAGMLRARGQEIATEQQAAANKTTDNRRTGTIGTASALSSLVLPTNQAKMPKPSLMDGVGMSNNTSGNFHPPVMEKDGSISRWNPDKNTYVNSNK